jgi:hypothetical protein
VCRRVERGVIPQSRQRTVPALFNIYSAASCDKWKKGARLSEHDNDEYRREAKDAQRRADEAKTAGDRAAWLRVVQGWLSLIGLKTAQTDENHFDERAKSEGTHQDISKKSQ